MDKEAINKELTELLGECWHEYHPYKKDYDGVVVDTFQCVCGFDNGYCEHSFKVHLQLKNNDFFTDSGYGKLRDVYDGWDEDKQLLFIGFIDDKDHEECDGIIMPYYLVYLHAFHRDNLAPLMLEFLKQEEQ